MFVTNCPRCNDPFRLPIEQLPEGAYAQCPWCRETFPISEVLGKLPPVLEVFSADGQRLSSASRAVAGAQVGALAGRDAEPFETLIGEDALAAPGFAVDQDLDRTLADETVAEEGWEVDQKQISGPEDWAEQDEARGESFDAVDPDATWDSGQAIAPMKVKPAPPRKKQGSGIRGVIGVVLGGLLALPIAGLLLILVGRTPDLGFWPFLGEESPRRNVAAPPIDLTQRDSQPTAKPNGRTLLAPPMSDSLVGEDDPADAALDEIMAAEDDPTTAAQTTAEQTTAEQTTAEPTADPASEQALPAEANVADSKLADSSLKMPADSSRVSIVPIDPEPAAANDAAQPPASEEADPAPADAIAADEKPAAEKAEPAAAVMNQPPAAGTTSESAELVEGAAQASKMLAEISAFEGAEQDRRGLLAKTFVQIAKVGELADGGSDSVRRLVNQMKASPILSDLEAAGQLWLGHPKRTSPGILLIGRPSQQGEAMQFDSGSEVSITAGERLPASSKVIVFGKVVQAGAEPSIELVYAEELP